MLRPLFPATTWLRRLSGTQSRLWLCKIRSPTRFISLRILRAFGTPPSYGATRWFGAIAFCRYYNGTSQAAPHVSGAAALLWSVKPSLKGQIDQTIALLNGAAHHVDASACGSSGVPNDVYGCG